MRSFVIEGLIGCGLLLRHQVRCVSFGNDKLQLMRPLQSDLPCCGIAPTQVLFYERQGGNRSIDEDIYGFILPREAFQIPNLR